MERTSSRSTVETADHLLSLVQEMVVEIHPGARESSTLNLDTSLDKDLGFDSLAQIELLGRIEKAFHVTLSEQILATVDTARDLLRAIMSAGSGNHKAIDRDIAAVKLAGVEEAPLGAPTLIEVLQWHVAKHPDRPHIRLYGPQEKEEIITYRDLWSGAERVAAGLQHFGLQAGESLLIMLPTGREYFFAFFGVLLAGAIPVPVYPPGRPKQIEEHLLRHSAIANNCLARIMVTVAAAKQFARHMHIRAVDLRQILTVNELLATSTEALPKFREPRLTSENIAFLQYTSGSTGMPKGVILTHGNLLANIRSMAKVINVTSEDVFVSWLPLYHDMGLIGAWLGSMHFACQLIIMSPLAFIARPQRWLWAIHRYRGTLSAAPNFAYELCQRRIEDKDIEGLDLSSWRIAFNGAEAVNPTTVREFTERFGSYGFRPEVMMPVYGLAESSVGLSFPRAGSRVRIDRIRRETFMDTGEAVPADESESEPLEFVACGEPLPGHQIRIVDRADRELPERMEGSLQFCGPSATTGYFRNPAKTSELFHKNWLDSGDKAYMAEGNVFITGRSKDIIIRAGRNIYPTELEEAIGNIEGIRAGNVAIFGSRTLESGTEKLVVLAETRKKDVQSLADIRIRINSIVTDLVGGPPDEIVLAPPNTVLKTSSGKIRRNASRDIFEQGLIGKPQQAVWLQLARFTAKSTIPRLLHFYHRVGAGFYASWCWFVYCLLAPVVGTLVFLLPTEKIRWWVIRIAVKILAAFTLTKILVRAGSNLPQKNEPCIFVANHASYLDGYVLAALLDRPFSFIAKAELQANSIVHILLKRIGTLFVERFDKMHGVDDARLIAEQRRGGRSLLFFPEGTFMRMPGLLPFKMGAFEIAARTGLPLVPIAVRGTRSILRSDSWFPRHGTITVTFGKPIVSAAAPAFDHDIWSTALHLRDKTREWLLNNCGEPDLGHERLRLQPTGPILARQ